jgi:hypothetical protein
MAAGFLLNTAFAQEDDEEYEVVLPDDAQTCVMPAAPDTISEEASYEQLVEAKKQISTFQIDVETYRACLRSAEDSPDLTAGNKQAIVSSFNYTVDMEERVAERFNEAVRSYKERVAEE